LEVLSVVVGIDVGGTKIAGAVMARDSSLRATATLPTPVAGLEMVAAVAELVERLQDECGERLLAAGVGVPSLIDSRTGRVRMTANLDLADIDVRAILQERLDMPIALENDANLAALGEHRIGAGREHGDIVLLTVGTGVGGGVIAGNKIFRGGSGTGAELGHMVVQADGPRCQRNCPNHGCLETMSSGTAIARDAGMPAEEVVRRARAGDATAIGVLDRAGRYLGVGLASLANIFNPDAFVIGGGVSAAGDLLLGPAIQEYRARALPPNAEADVVLALLGPRAGAIGAGLLAWDVVDGNG
jgi:glucokinase